MSRPKQLRCAVYTRKSSDEGLDQEFNSLDAQREACEAYIASQKHEGWKLLPARYDDGGVSGATLERAGLDALLADIDAGRVDLVVVYKVDRLTRSLADFAKLIDRLDAAGASFVSVTQAFNTSTSMGRLTLNVLLSFAQFEREVTAERIRDKIAQSKSKGMWMGGYVPLGYDVDGRTLKTNENEAQTVITLFQLYDELGCLRKVEQAAFKLGLKTKDRSAANDRMAGSAPFSRGRIQHLLRNPLYIGKIRHKDAIHEGLHKAIVEADLFERVQDKLTAASNRPSKIRSARVTSPLAGKVFDQDGKPLTPSHATRGTKRYRYYVSRASLSRSESPSNTIIRLPAAGIETAVSGAVRNHATHNASELIRQGDPSLSEIDARRAALEAVIALPKPQLLNLVTRVTLGASSIEISVRLPEPDWDPAFRTEVAAPFTLRRRGVERKVILGDCRPDPDKKLQRTLGRALIWRSRLLAGEQLETLAANEGVSSRFLRDRLQLAFLSPRIMKAIAEGTQPPELSTNTLVRAEIPLHWHEQEKLFGF